MVTLHSSLTPKQNFINPKVHEGTIEASCLRLVSSSPWGPVRIWIEMPAGEEKDGCVPDVHHSLNLDQ